MGKGQFQGALDLLIVKVRARLALHGYGIAQRIQQISDEVLRVEEGSLYPALHRIEEEGWRAAAWGDSENNRRAKYYRLTKARGHQLKTETKRCAQVSVAVTRALQAS